MNSLKRKHRLEELVEEYLQFKQAGKLNLTSEETIRTWLNELLSIFGWDVKDTSEILQEKTLSKIEKDKLKSIGSQNTRPDYTFKIAKQKLTFLDAKDVRVNLATDAKAAFQIKSYGWSITAPCAFISNFEEFVIYDCTYIPSPKQAVTFGRIYLKIEDYVENYELLETHLLKENVYNGKLNDLYSSTLKNIKGIKKITPDFVFAEVLSRFRLILAKDIYFQNQNLIQNNAENLSYIVQVLINRILFIRVCEARKLEEEGLLLSFKKQGFWDSFKKSSYFEFYEHYDGVLFDRIDTIHNLKISDAVFDDLLKYLYYPSPYRFDVIPTKLLSDIYEIFLSKKLNIKNKEIEDETKSEYSKTKGAVSTPQYIVAEIIRRTIQKDELLHLGLKGLFGKKILDIACGSGVFMIELYDYLEDVLKSFYQQGRISHYQNYFIKKGNNLIVNLEGKKAIIENCIFGIDIDSEAVEVAKMSLALKAIDSTDYMEAYEEIGFSGRKILEGIGKNIRCGNSLVGSEIFDTFPSLIDDEKQLLKTNPFDWRSKEGFETVFKEKGGFDYIIGNPPYVEVKNYNDELPYMHQFIKTTYTSAKNGKIDLAIPFIEKTIALLNPSGRLGFIVQKRFFKTNYGKKIREIISSQNLVSSIVDFETTKIFKGRITYVSILILDKKAPSHFYYCLFKSPISTLQSELRNSQLPEENPTSYHILPADSITETPWGFDDPTLISIRTKLLSLGKLGDIAKVKVGIQVLWDKAYHIEVSTIENGILKGKTHLEDSVQIEANACRPLICNENFYPYKSDNTKTYVIFPYEIVKGKTIEIPFSKFQQKYPLACQYLVRNKATILKNVDTWKETERWHFFTRVQNHGATYPKILIPMTSLDTYASLSFSDNHYCDNANVYFIELQVKTELHLYAVSAVINSIVFSVLARSIANPQSNGYFKFNKQFLEPIPFPIEAFHHNKNLLQKLAHTAKSIEQQQYSYQTASPIQKRVLKIALERKWKKLDNQVYELYGLSKSEINFFNERGRNVNRVNLLNQ